MTRLQITVAAWVAAGAACGGTAEPEAASPPRSSATITFVYVAATSIDEGVAQQFPACVQGAGQTHIHPSWLAFDRRDMTNGGDRWAITLPGVPVGSRERIRLNDPNACAENPTGAVTRNVFANGVRLTAVVDTPGSGAEPGLAFTVGEDGEVMP
jgi:hypothetical protein